MNNWYSTSKLTIQLTVDNSAVAVVNDIDSHFFFLCCGDCCCCVGLIIIFVLPLHCCHHAPSPQHNPLPPTGPVAWHCGCGQIRPRWLHQKHHLCQGAMTPAQTDCHGKCQHCPISIVFVLKMSGIAVAVYITCRCPVASPCPHLPPILTAPSTTCPSLLLTVILFFPGSPP